MKPTPTRPDKSQFSEMEERIVAFWDTNNTFQRSVEERPAHQSYSFYDGPPFATGLPHYGHILASIKKDMLPRYQTMRGKRVERVWGWDCHGLPIENIIEKELNLKTKHDIEQLGIAQFNDACRSTVLTYAEEWKKTIKRLGRWVDMEHDYKTMDKNFMESVWWVFKQLWDRGLIYEGKKSMHVCARCVTPLSNFEVTLGYKDVTDSTATPQFKITNPENIGLSGDVYMLAWTTTPWTLPGNVLLAVNPELEYVAIQVESTEYGTESSGLELTAESSIKAGATYIFAAERYMDFTSTILSGQSSLEEVRASSQYVRSFKGKELAGLRYQPLFPYFKDTENAFQVVAEEFVTATEGTGIVHIAPAFGEDDYRVGEKHAVPFIQHVTMEGKFIPEVVDFQGVTVRSKGNPGEVDKLIIEYLQQHDGLFATRQFTHSYPHCWRCDTPLLNYATSSWFVRVTEMKEDLLANNAKIHWVPEHIQEGRFGQWLENARDWAISRNRYWGTPLPIWRSEDGDILCVGSVAELEKLTGKSVADLHKHYVDDLVIEHNGKTYRRIPEVLDCWFESGAMPYAELHYPFENREKFEQRFPADYISEAQDQTRGWFYTLHVLATALTRGENPAIPVRETMPAFKNVSIFGIVLAADGKKMSKKLKNYPDPTLVLEKYGADALRLYMTQSPVVEMEPLNFSEKDVDELHRKYTNTLWNVYTFYQMFAEKESEPITEIVDVSEVLDPMDAWILTQLELLLQRVTVGYETYHLREAALPLIDFVQELSTWYVRRIRARCKGDDAQSRRMALRTLYTVLSRCIRIAAPVTPFITEEIYQRLRTAEQVDSVHLASWPEQREQFVNTAVLAEMDRVRTAIEQLLALRAEHKLKVRQPLNSATITGGELADELKAVIMEELNVKAVHIGSSYALDTQLTPELKAEGLLRELVRQTNAIRKQKKFTLNDRIDITIATSSEQLRSMLIVYGEDYQRQVLGASLTVVDAGEGEAMVCDGEALTISVIIHG